MSTTLMTRLLLQFRASRRDLLSGFSGLLARCIGASAGVAGLSAQQAQSRSVYEGIGIRPLINARGTVTIIGATRMLPEVKAAMEAASREFVQIDELMDGVSRRLAELTGAEWGVVTAGASAALTIATAGCVTGGDPDKAVQLPNLAGMKDEVIMPSYSRTAYDAAARSVGVRIIEVKDPEQLREAMGPRTAMVMILAGSASTSGPLPTRIIAELAKPRGIPVLVDAAAEELVVPNPHLKDGADLVAYSGGKCLRGPQCAGLLLGRKNLVQAAWIHSAPHHGLGRGMKVGREEIMGMLAAVEMWHRRDHAAEQSTWTSWLNDIGQRLGQVQGVKAQILPPRGLSNRTPTLKVSWDGATIPLTGYDVEKLLWEGEPRIAVSGAGSYLPFPPNFEPSITIVPYQLEAGEERIIADRVFAVLSNPPMPRKNVTNPALNLSGQWDVVVHFAATSAQHRFILEQKDSELAGTHFGSFAARDMTGTIHGEDVLLRSSYTRQGVRLNFEFTGLAEAGRMGGNVSLGEYGRARWEANRRTYGRNGLQ